MFKYIKIHLYIAKYDASESHTFIQNFIEICRELHQKNGQGGYLIII